MSEQTQAQQQSSRRRSRSSGRRNKPVRPFWGDADTAAGPEHTVTPVDHPTALVDSLGSLPFPRADASPHYFAAVYTRAAAMAVALATAAGLVETDDDTDEAPDPNA